jgi:uncharacterized coiled-coil protein SlyX
MGTKIRHLFKKLNNLVNKINTGRAQRTTPPPVAVVF